MKINERIKIIRIAKKWSQEIMAEKLEISSSAYGDIERGETELTLSKLEKLAEVFELPLHELVDFREETKVEFGCDKSKENQVCITTPEERTIESFGEVIAFMKRVE